MSNSNDEILSLFPEHYEKLESVMLGAAPLSACDGGTYVSNCDKGTNYNKCCTGGEDS